MQLVNQHLKTPKQLAIQINVLCRLTIILRDTANGLLLRMFSIHNRLSKM